MPEERRSTPSALRSVACRYPAHRHRHIGSGKPFIAWFPETLLGERLCASPKEAPASRLSIIRLAWRERLFPRTRIELYPQRAARLRSTDTTSQALAIWRDGIQCSAANLGSPSAAPTPCLQTDRSVPSSWFPLPRFCRTPGQPSVASTRFRMAARFWGVNTTEPDLVLNLVGVEDSDRVAIRTPTALPSRISE